MKIPFTKMHGLGNDFILIDCLNKAVNYELSAISSLIKRLCRRRFGIGADQMLLLSHSDRADFMMRIYNADGSEVEMCGNGIRCLAKYIWDRGLSGKNIISVETPAGIIMPERSGDMVRVDMGEPVLEGRLIPVNHDGPVKDLPLKVADMQFDITCVSMGNPHAVIFVDNMDEFDVQRYGSLIEYNEIFPKRTNVEFVLVEGPDSVRMRVWERGTGETMACGTGASAAAVAANLKGLTGRLVNVSLPGGKLIIEWNENNHVYMTGPAVEVFEGTVNVA